MGVLSRFKRRVGGTARLVKDAVGAIADSARPGAAPVKPGPAPAPSVERAPGPPPPGAPAPVDTHGADGEPFWFLDGGQADEGWGETNPSEAWRQRHGVGDADGQ